VTFFVEESVGGGVNVFENAVEFACSLIVGMQMKFRLRGIGIAEGRRRREVVKTGGKKCECRYAMAKLEEKFASTEVYRCFLFTAFAQRAAPIVFTL
jgi:hypothetical protein